VDPGLRRGDEGSQSTPGAPAHVALEMAHVPLAGLATLLLSEPPGLSIGKVVLQDRSIVLGIRGEPFLCEGRREFTVLGGWRTCTAAQQ
jgi:hypothetical protein